MSTLNSSLGGKKILTFIVLLLSTISLVNATVIEKISKENSKMYKEAILTRAYIRDNIKDGEKIIYIIEIYFNNIRKDKNIEKLEILKSKTGELLKNYVNKKTLTKNEKNVYNLVKNLYYRSYIELIVYGKIDL